MPTFVPLTYRVGGTSRASSLRNPCPSGTSIGYGTFDINGTDFILLYCDSAFSGASTLTGEDLSLALGLGLGLGIPFFFVLFCICHCWCNRTGCFDPYRNMFKNQKVYIRNEAKVEPITENTRRRATDKVNKLPSSIRHDFERGLLTEQLKQELMLLRIEAEVELTDFALMAELQKHHTLASWIRDMKPETFPPEIQEHWQEIRAGTNKRNPDPSDIVIS